MHGLMFIIVVAAAVALGGCARIFHIPFPW
jgi:hypothetical protein